MTVVAHRYSNALRVIEDAFTAHYETGDYALLGIALQEAATEVLVALRTAVALEDFHASS
jgi:uncharacterized protein (DUF488 family)